MSYPLAVGILGLGEVCQLMHLPILSDNSDKFEICGVYDISRQATEYVARRYPPARAYPSAEALCRDDGIDAIFILTPDHTHAEYLQMGIEQKKHIFVEKPVCLTHQELANIIPMADQSNQVVFVAYMRRYARSFLKAKELMPKMSDIRTVRVRDLICEGSFFVAQTRKIFYPEDIPAAVIKESLIKTERLIKQVTRPDASPDLIRSYQVLTGLSSHSLSAMRELIGTPKDVIAATQRLGGEALVVLFDYGHFVAVYEAMIDNIARFEARIDVLSDNQQLQISYDTPYIRNLPLDLKVTRSNDQETRTTIYGPDYTDPFHSELLAFYGHICDKKAPKTSLRDSLDDLTLLAKIASKIDKAS